MAEAGDLIDVWVVEARLGGGGTAQVYRCHNKDATRILAAVKLLDPAVSKYPNAKARFIREAEILFTLDHPGIVKVRNVRFDVDAPYLEMEWVVGESLERVLRRGPVPYEQVLQRMTELMEAIEYLHRKGIRHRDIKPANIILANTGNLVLVDFGLAVELAGERITSSEAMFGTVSYAPPEWVTPTELDPRAWDIYACGIVFFEMLTGAVAFPVPRDAGARRQALQVMTAKREVDHVDPGDPFPEAARALIRRMTAKDPEARPKTAADVLVALHRLDPNATGNLTPGALQRRAEKRPTNPTILSPESQLENEWGGDTWNTEAVSQAPGEAETAVRQRPDLPTAPPSTPTSSGPQARGMGGLILGGVLALLALGGLGLVGIVVVAQALTGSTPRERAVDVVVAGIGHPEHVGVRVAGQRPVGRDGFTYHFRHIPSGEDATVAWTVGPSCDDLSCPGTDCAAWCATGALDRAIPHGNDPFLVSLELEPPAARDLKLTAPAISEAELRVRYHPEGSDDPNTAAGSGSVTLAGLAPGTWALEVEAGACPEACSTWSGQVVLPLGEGVFPFEVAIEAPPKAKTKAKAKAKDTGGRTAGRPVSQQAFAGWLAAHPTWARDAAMAAGKADANYLRGFDPGAASGATMTGVSWAAAQAFCQGRGGLAPLAATPHAWEESATQPFQEWRAEGGRPAWRRFDGATSTAARAGESNAFTGFRCSR